MDNVHRFLDELASGAPVPGGGSVAALQVATSAGLLSMVCNLTLGRKRYAGVQGEVSNILQESESLRAQAETLVDEDARAYGEVAKALAMPKTSEMEKATRARTIQVALKGAAEPPLTCMRLARTALELSERLMDICNTNAISDIGVATLGARAGHRAARLNVDINLAAVEDTQWRERMQQSLTDLPDPDQLERRVLARVESIISGTNA